MAEKLKKYILINIFDKCDFNTLDEQKLARDMLTAEQYAIAACAKRNATEPDPVFQGWDYSLTEVELI